MNIEDTFVVVRDSLLAVKYDIHATHEFTRLFNLWNDPEYLHEFFTEHESDLCNGFFGNINVEAAVIQTRQEAKALERKILHLAKNGRRNKDLSLATLFKPLTEHPGKFTDMESSKAKGAASKSWLRIYAIRPLADDLNFFVVSGGTIKLTRSMQESVHIRRSNCKK